MRGSRHFCTDQVNIKKQHQLGRVGNLLDLWYLQNTWTLAQKKKIQTGWIFFALFSSRGHRVGCTLNFQWKLRSYLPFVFFFFWSKGNTAMTYSGVDEHTQQRAQLLIIYFNFADCIDLQCFCVDMWAWGIHQVCIRRLFTVLSLGNPSCTFS